MKSKLKSPVWGLVGMLALLPCLCEAQTLLSGNISGTWSPSGNPYVITDNATVPSGQSLTIQPGVIVWIGVGISINVNGNIQAIGTPNNRITIQAPITSQHWNGIAAGASGTQFAFCDFWNAATAISIESQGSAQIKNCTFNDSTNAIGIFGNVGTTGVQIMNCTFSNCVSSAIYGNGGYDGAISPVIENCVFQATGNGCVLNDYSYADIEANIFENLSGTALLIQPDSLGTGTTTFINNVVVNCAAGAYVRDPNDTKIQNCVFENCNYAVKVSGSLSRSVSYNDFFGNQTNFVGYPSTYGSIIIVNHNGTPCDLLYNIFQDPKFVSSNNFTLQANSPCIDAGTPDPTYIDMSFPPSQGTGLPDLGIYGGPIAANWLPVIPSTPAPITLSASKALKLTCNNVVAAGSYQIQSSPDLASWTNYGSQFYMAATSNLVQYVDATNNAGFFRLKSLP